MDRRKFLSTVGIAGTTAALPGISGANGTGSDDVDEFISLLQEWQTEYGEVVDISHTFTESEDHYTRAEVTYEFESEDTKSVIIIATDKLYILYRRSYFVIDDPEELSNELHGPRTNASGGSVPTPDPGDGGSGPSEIINPGESETWTSGDGSTTDTEYAIEMQNEAEVNEFAYHAEAKTEGVGATWANAFASVYNTFETGTDGTHPRTTMSFEIDFSVDGITEAAFGDANARVGAFLRDNRYGEIRDEEFIIDESISYFGRETFRIEDGSQTLEHSARPETEYDVGMWVATSAATVSGTSTVQSNFFNPGLEVNRIELSWK